ncbi:MAG: hypothetical protein MUC54_00615 [Chloroflexi bacterium]|nr:hypothetical protein [Chloroflexota bacterium]
MIGTTPQSAVGVGVGCRSGVGVDAGDGVGARVGSGGIVSSGLPEATGMAVADAIAAGVADGLDPEEQAASSPAAESVISIPVQLLVGIGQLPGRLVGARARIGPCFTPADAGETLRLVAVLRDR